MHSKSLPSTVAYSTQSKTTNCEVVLYYFNVFMMCAVKPPKAHHTEI